jgi:Kef-type K+ transport system membrane component KefB
MSLTTDSGVDSATGTNTTMTYDNNDDVIDNQVEELFPILYRSMLFLLLLYIMGDILCGKIIKIIPPLVGQIGMGMILGPHVLAFVPDIVGWPYLGEVGLVLLLCQAGLEMDFDVLRQVGPRGAVMALVGSILPTSLGFLLAYMVLDLPPESALALGCSFGPTSAGIALNVLHPCGVLKTALGQLIVAIAIVDDIIALVVLSQLQALTAETLSAAAIAIPIVSALLWLFGGGAVALYIMPKILTCLSDVEEKVLDLSSNKRETSDTNSDEVVEIDDNSLTSTLDLAHIIILLFALLPATYYSKASPLLGAFLTGLSACQQCSAADKYNHELDKIISWLIRIFFGASIAFVIPVQLFGDPTVIARGFLLSLALLGKIMTGPLLTPVEFQDSAGATDGSCRRRFDRQHIRDCLVVGFSMAGEAEFAMLVAGFGFREGLLEEAIYASTVFAILLSTILSPCLLRLTLALFGDENDNKYDATSHENEETGEAQNTEVEM